MILAGLAMLFAAATTHADMGSIDWVITGPPNTITHVDGVTGVAVGWKLYLILGDLQTKNDIVAAINEGTFNFLVDELTLGSALTAGPAPGMFGGEKTATSELLTPGQGYQYTVLYFNEEYTGLAGSSGSYFFSMTMPTGEGTRPAYLLEGFPYSTGAVPFGGTLPGTDESFNNTGTWHPYLIPIPEPSTAALLVLGVAALGSRRRVRK
jgi:PEP-CTERM putative exosortase interaction domain